MEDTQIATAQDNDNAGEITTVSTINKLYAEAEAVSKMSKDYAQKAIEIALECGRLLIEQKKDVGHGNWEQWCKDNLTFHVRTAKRYMGLYRKTSERYKIEVGEEPKRTQMSDLTGKVKNLRQAYIATGILPEKVKTADEIECDRIHKLNKASPYGILCQHVKKLDNFVKYVRDVTAESPYEEWTQTQRRSMMLDLRPIVEIFNDLRKIEEDFFG